jgi:hypothetical protein
MRAQSEVWDEVLSRAGRYRVVHPKCDESDAHSPLDVKEVYVEGRRYIVCRNQDEAHKDEADREAIVAALRGQLRQRDKSLIGNKGYRRYVSQAGPGGFGIDEAGCDRASAKDFRGIPEVFYPQSGVSRSLNRSMTIEKEAHPTFEWVKENVRPSIKHPRRLGKSALFRALDGVKF